MQTQDIFLDQLLYFLGNDVTFVAGSYPLISFADRLEEPSNRRDYADIDIYYGFVDASFNESQKAESIDAEIKRIINFVNSCGNELSSYTSRDFYDEEQNASAASLLIDPTISSFIQKILTINVKNMKPIQIIFVKRAENIDSLECAFICVSDKIGTIIMRSSKVDDSYNAAEPKFVRTFMVPDYIQDALNNGIIPVDFFANETRANKYRAKGFTIASQLSGLGKAEPFRRPSEHT